MAACVPNGIVVGSSEEEESSLIWIAIGENGVYVSGVTSQGVCEWLIDQMRCDVTP